MFIVYAIKSLKDGRIYVGFSKSVQRRLAEHNKGQVFSTKGFRPWKIIYKEAAANRSMARKHEKALKSGFGKEFLKTLE